MHSVRKRLNEFQISSDTQFLRCLEQLHCIQALNLGGDTTPDGLTGSQEASSVLGGCEKVGISLSLFISTAHHMPNTAFAGTFFSTLLGIGWWGVAVRIHLFSTNM